jgi:hypothetical protein
MLAWQTSKLVLGLVNYTSKDSRENVFKIGHQKIIWCWLGKHQKTAP